MIICHPCKFLFLCHGDAQCLLLFAYGLYMVAIIASSSLFQVVTYIDVSVLYYRFPIVIDTFPFEYSVPDIP